MKYIVWELISAYDGFIEHNVASWQAATDKVEEILKPASKKGEPYFADWVAGVMPRVQVWEEGGRRELVLDVFVTTEPLLGNVERADPERPAYDENKDPNEVCECGHVYYRHFDTYEDMRPVGCKYCRCDEFVPKNG